MTAAAPVFPPCLDSTMVVTWRSCPQKFYQAFCRQLELNVFNIHLFAGGAIASSMEVTRRAYYVDGLSANAAVNKGAHHLIRYWGDADPGPKTPKQFWNVLLAFYNYFKEWHLDFDPIRPIIFHDRPAIEFTFAVPLPIAHPVTGDPILYGGRFDMAGVVGGVDPTIIDEKTTGAGFDIRWSRSWDMRNQFIGYCWGAQQSGLRISRTMVRGIHILKTKPPKYAQSIIEYPDWLIDRWYQQLLRDVQRMVGQWQLGIWDYNFGDACSGYSGCGQLIRCTSSQPDDWLSLYRPRVWDPLSPSGGEIFSPEMEQLQELEEHAA